MPTPLTLTAFSALATVLGADRKVSFKGNTLKLHDLSSSEAHRVLALLNPSASTALATTLLLDNEKIAEAVANAKGAALPSLITPEEARAALGVAPTETKPAKAGKVKKSPEPSETKPETKNVPLLEATVDPPPADPGLPATSSAAVPVDENGNPDPWGLAGKNKPAETAAPVGDIDVTRFDAKRLGEMGKLRDILPYLREEMGVAGYKAMLATCNALKAAQLSPILDRIENLEERLLRGFETLGWSTAD